jgi:hypothetical protein
VVIVEAYSIQPMSYDVDLLKQYKSVVTWNSKFYEQNKDHMNIYLMKDFFCAFDLKDECNYLDCFIDYDNKIKGVCLVSNLLTYYDSNVGAIGYKRLEIMKNLNNGLIKHVYGSNDCGEMYRGVIGEKNPNYSSIDIFKHRRDKVKRVNEYLFSLVCENSYHEFWSWDYITEKIWDAFMAKTVPVYYGCYNIEQRIPRDLYVDYRNFKTDNELSEYLTGFPKAKYINMVNRAFDFYKQQRPCFLMDLKQILARI